jgi:hypothetical protein
VKELTLCQKCVTKLTSELPQGALTAGNKHSCAEKGNENSCTARVLNQKHHGPQQKPVQRSAGDERTSCATTIRTLAEKYKDSVATTGNEPSCSKDQDDACSPAIGHKLPIPTGDMDEPPACAASSETVFCPDVSCSAASIHQPPLPTKQRVDPTTGMASSEKVSIDYSGITPLHRASQLGMASIAKVTLVTTVVVMMLLMMIVMMLADDDDDVIDYVDAAVMM